MSGRVSAVLMTSMTKLRSARDWIFSRAHPVRGALGRVVLRLEAGDVEPHPNGRRMLIEVRVRSRNGHQTVLEGLVSPDEWIRFTSEGIYARIADILEVNKRGDLSATSGLRPVVTLSISYHACPRRAIFCQHNRTPWNTNLDLGALRA